jgi:hypothetical protein
MLPGETVVSRNITRGISQMGTTYFLLFIATSLGGLLLFLRKIDSKSFRFRPKDAAPDLPAFRTTKRRNVIEQARDEAYVNWYMTRLESARCAKEQRQHLGTAFMANDPVCGTSNQRSRAIH